MLRKTPWSNGSALRKPPDFRDKEKRLIEDLEEAQAEWDKESEEVVYDVTEDDVARVVAMMTALP